MRDFQHFVNDSNPADPQGVDKLVNAVLDLKTRNESNSTARQSRRLAIAMENQRRARSSEFKICPGKSAERFEAKHITIVGNRPIQVLDVDEQPSNIV